jgi:hypothetical protein
MKKKRVSEIDREYALRVKASTPEQRLEWLETAAEFARAKKTIVTRKK